MTVQPSVPGAADPVAQANAIAQQLSSLSLGQYGSLPNPQLAFEAISHPNAVPYLAGAISAGSAAYQSLISSVPPISAPGAQPGAVAAQPTVEQQALHTFDWQQYRSGLHGQLSQDNNAGWRSFGEIPQINLAYMHGVENQSDPKRIRQWQTMLTKSGLYSGSATGVWDQATDSAFRMLMISRAAPVALYAKDAGERNRASAFLANFNIDGATLESEARDPKEQHDMVVRWLAAQGPDQNVGDKNVLQHFVDQFGSDHLPQPWQKVMKDNTPNGFLSILGGIASAMPVIGGFLRARNDPDPLHKFLDIGTGIIPGAALAENVLGIMQPPDHQTENIKKQLAAADKMMAPLVSGAVSQSGFLGVFNQWDRMRTNAILSTTYLFEDWGQGQDPRKQIKNVNPFDPTSDVGTKVTAADGDLARGLFGQGFEDRFPWLASSLNSTANVLDDPISYLPVGGAAEKGLTAVSAGARATRMMLHDAAPDIQATADELIKQSIRANSHMEMSKLIPQFAKSPQHQGVFDSAALMGGVGQGETAWARLNRLRQVEQAPDETSALEHYQALDMGHKLVRVSGFTNYRAYLNSLGSVLAKRLSRQDLVGMWAHLSLPQLADEMKWETDPFAAGKTFQKWMNLAGMDPAAIKASLDGIVDATPEERLNAVHATYQQLNTALDGMFKTAGRGGLDQFFEWQKRNRWSRSLNRIAGRDAMDEKQSGYLAGLDGKEESFTSAAAPDAVTAQYEIQIKNTEDAIAAQASLLDETDANLERFGRTIGGGARERAEDAMSRLQAHLEDLRQQHTLASRRPAPFIPTQLRDGFHLPYTMSEAVTYLHPSLANWERAANNIVINAFTSVWKPIQLATFRSSFRIALGDEAIRPNWQLAFSGHPIVAARSLARTIGHLGAMGVPSSIHVPRVLRPALRTAETAIRGKTAESEDRPERKQIPMGNKIPLPGGHDIPLRGELMKRAKANLTSRNARDLMAAHQSQYTEGVSEHGFAAVGPQDPEYGEKLVNQMNTWANDPMIQRWIKGFGGTGPGDEAAGAAAIAAWHGEQSPASLELRRLSGLSDPEQDAQLRSHKLAEIFADNELRQMLASGKIDSQRISSKVHYEANQPGSRLPIFNYPKDTLIGHNVISKMLTGPPRWWHDHVTGPMIHVARSDGMDQISDRWYQELKNHYKGQPNWTEEKLRHEADDLAHEWMNQNVYFGHRTVLGTSLRNAFPFWGATANMNRFYLRQAVAHPFSGSAAYHIATSSTTAQQNKQQYAVGFQGALALLGFSGGDALSLDPWHAFFLTSDGINSTIPGLGPVFTPLLNAVAANPEAASALQGLPGIGLQVDYATGQAQPLESWMGKLVSGIGTEITGQPFSVPFVGEGSDYIKQRVDQLVRQREAEGHTVSADDITGLTREVGRKLALEGALSFATPLSPAITYPHGQELSNALNAWYGADSEDAKTALIAGHIGVKPDAYTASIKNNTVAQLLSKDPKSAANLLAFFDTRVSPEERDIIAQQSPWVNAYATSMYNEPAGKPLDLQQFQSERKAGQLSVQDPSTYIAMVQGSRNINEGWLAVDDLRNQRTALLAQVGGDTQSPEYRQWEATVYQPGLAAIETENADFRKSFGQTSGGRSLSELAVAGLPLRTLMTMSVIPQDPAFETGSTALWRQALVWKDEAARQIAFLQSGSHSTQEVDLVLAGLQQRLAGLAAQDPKFASQLARYSFAKWDDVVSYEADQLRTQQLYGGGAGGY